MRVFARSRECGTGNDESAAIGPIAGSIKRKRSESVWMGSLAPVYWLLGLSWVGWHVLI